MVTLAAKASGNFTASTTWGVVDSTSFLGIGTTQTVLTASYVASQNFTPGAITIDGVGVFVTQKYALASNDGTMSVKLYNSTDAAEVVGSEITINVSDIFQPASLITGQTGWIFFKFAAPITLIAGKAYNVQAKTSVANRIYLCRDATAANWLRYLRTTTEQAPASTNDLIIANENTGTGTSNQITVTMDNTDTTSFGSGLTSANVVYRAYSIEISNYAKLTYGNSASTNYNLRFFGQMWIRDGGSLEIGTVANPIPSTSTAKLEFNCTADGDTGIYCIGDADVIIQGIQVRDYAWTYLNADASIGATSLTTADTTNWKSGDRIRIAKTSSTNTTAESEERTLSVDASGTTLTVSALTYAHTGTGDLRAEIINIEKNVRVISVSTTNTGFIYLGANSNFNADWASFETLGYNAGDKYGITFETTSSGSFAVNNCAFENGFYTLYTPSGGSNFTIEDCVFYGGGNSCTNHISVSDSANFAGYSIQRCVFIRSSSYSVLLQNITGTIKDINIGGSVAGLSITESNIVSPGVYENIIIHSVTTGTVYGVSIGTCDKLTITNLKVWKCFGSGIYIGGARGLRIATGYSKGNGNGGFLIADCWNCIVKDFDMEGLVGSNQSWGAYTTTGSATNFIFNNCDFGSTTAHSISDIQQNTFDQIDFTFINCLLNSPTKIVFNSSGFSQTNLKFQNYNNTIGDYRCYMKYGVLYSNTADARSGKCLQMVPSDATYKLSTRDVQRDKIFYMPAQNGVLRTAKIYAKKSVDYNGSNPRLSLYMNGEKVAGETAFAITASYVQYTITYTPSDNGILEMHVDCDGTVGSIFLDDFSYT